MTAMTASMPPGQELQGKVAAVTGAASGIGFASAQAMANAGARVVLIDRDEAALTKACAALGPVALPLVLDLLDARQCASLLQRTLALAGQLDIFHANAGLYVGGDLVDADPDAIDRMLNLNVNVVMKNVHNVLPHMIERGTGDIRELYLGFLRSAVRRAALGYVLLAAASGLRHLIHGAVAVRREKPSAKQDRALVDNVALAIDNKLLVAAMRQHNLGGSGTT